jgi:hypothetical protein
MKEPVSCLANTKFVTKASLLVAAMFGSAAALADNETDTIGRGAYPTAVVNLKTKQCLTSTGGELSVVIQDHCSGAPDRMWQTELIGPGENGWYYFRLRNAQTGLCADLQTYSDADGLIAQRQCSGEPSQQWHGVPIGNQYQYARVINRATKKCLDGQVGGPNVTQWTCGSRDNQFWLINF